MITAPLLVALVAAALGIVALVLNQVQARLGLVELTLNDGWPPGHAPTNEAHATAPSVDPHAALEPGLHVFLSRGCHACQRLVDELAERRIPATVPNFHYVDRARASTRALATAWNAELVEGERELAAALGADPLPYAIGVGPHGLVARSVVPTSSSLIGVARSAGLDTGPVTAEATT